MFDARRLNQAARLFLLASLCSHANADESAAPVTATEDPDGPSYSSLRVQDVCGFERAGGLSNHGELADAAGPRVCAYETGAVRQLQAPANVAAREITIAALDGDGGAVGMVIPEDAGRPWQYLMTVWNADGSVRFSSDSPPDWITPGGPVELNVAGAFIGTGFDETGMFWSRDSDFIRLPAPTPIAVQNDIADTGVIAGHGIDSSRSPPQQSVAIVWDDPSRPGEKAYLVIGKPGSAARAINGGLTVAGCDRESATGPLLPRIWQLDRADSGLIVEAGRHLGALGPGCLLDVNDRGDAVGYVEREGRQQAVLYSAAQDRLRSLSELVSDRCLSCLGEHTATRINDRGEILLQADTTSYLLRPGEDLRTAPEAAAEW